MVSVKKTQKLNNCFKKNFLTLLSYALNSTDIFLFDSFKEKNRTKERDKEEETKRMRLRYV